MRRRAETGPLGKYKHSRAPGWGQKAPFQAQNDGAGSGASTKSMAPVPELARWLQWGFFLATLSPF